MLCLTSCSEWMGVYTLPSFIPLWRHRSALSIHTTQNNPGKSGQRCRKSPGKQREKVKGLIDIWHISVHEWLVLVCGLHLPWVPLLKKFSTIRKAIIILHTQLSSLLEACHYPSGQGKQDHSMYATGLATSYEIK